jgi:hypothetical protein
VVSIHAVQGAIHILDGIGGVARTFTDLRALAAELLSAGAFPANDNANPQVQIDIEAMAALAGYSCQRVAGPTGIGRPGDWIWWMEAAG